jgi:hypothetical protein
MKKTVEYYRLWDDHTWDTDFIEVEDVPDLNHAVIEASQKIEWVDNAPVIVGLYYEGE